ncbi:MAG: prepilin-type N-terminal cleavage/methylation domain-containing protein [Patescibacteria group bacterium]|nr:prepilin-type N-terminal cleavage/methylation domain-containing protein [Patescibacteria group bacterium]
MKNRHGFTMLELLVAIGIILLMTSLAVAVFTTTMNADRIRSSARQVQSALAGARDRALRAGRDAPGSGQFGNQRGLRFMVDNPPLLPAGTATVSQMMYVGNLAPFAGTASLFYDSRGAPRELHGTANQWVSLFNQGVLTNNSTVQLNHDGRWYGIASAPTTVTTGPGAPYDVMQLSADYLTASPSTGTAGTAVTTPVNPFCAIQLGNATLPGAQPITLSSSIVINLNNSSNVPAYAATGYFDIMFSPRGVVTGSASAKGLIHLFLAESTDVIAGVAPTAPASKDKLICTLSTRTGNVATYPVNVSGASPDLYLFAKQGFVAGK